MEEFKHIDPLALQSTELTDRTPFCPDDLLISEYFDGVIPDRERQKMEHHLADCRYCMARIGMLNRQQDDTPAGDVPGQVLADAKALAKNAASRRANELDFAAHNDIVPKNAERIAVFYTPTSRIRPGLVGRPAGGYPPVGCLNLNCERCTHWKSHGDA